MQLTFYPWLLKQFLKVADKFSKWTCSCLKFRFNLWNLTKMINSSWQTVKSNPVDLHALRIVFFGVGSTGNYDYD